MHIVSNVRGRLEAGKDAFDAFRATFPAGTLSGAPKIRAMEIIEELEPVRRGVYGGAVGYFDFSGNMDTGIAIRTALCKNGRVYVQAGAGIVADSVPEREHLECLNKARGMFQALRLAEREVIYYEPAPPKTRGFIRAGSPKPPFSMILMIDNYDSFTYNLVQYLGELGEQVKVVRNDELGIDAIEALAPERIVISPGPCTPNEAGVSLDVIGRFAGRVPILGVCLGHQAIGQAFGGKVVHARQLMHGKVSPIHHAGQGVFRGLPSPFSATRYHSLAVERASCPEVLEITAWPRWRDRGLRHRTSPSRAWVPPQSILTDTATRAAILTPGD
jgi:anthranilate synthase/aminodeoxychorismate synthase-like glutamine amidotransferase